MKILDRQAVVAHRVRVQGLHGGLDLGVLDLGLQDAPAGSAGHALAVRTGDPDAGDSPDLVRVLGIRGAPHVHRRRDLPGLRRELRPRSAEELLGWLAGHAPAFAASGVDGLAVLDQTVTLLRERFPGETATKGELSAAISPALPAPARPWCVSCQAEHVIENLFRLATLLAGLELERGDRRLVFRAPREPVEPDGTPPDGALLRGFTRYAGPLRFGDASDWLSGTASNAPQPRGWAEIFDELTPVRIDGTEYRMATDDLENGALPPVLLLPPRDPYLTGNRSFVVPDRNIAKQVWKAQVSPGTLLVDGEICGVWRQRISGRTISVTVTSSGRQHRGVRGAVNDQAELLAAVRGGSALEPEVVWEG